MRQAARTARYDQALGLEAYSLRAVDRPFPSHFHDHYVIGVVERGTRTLTCGRQRQVIGPGDVLLFNPGDSHACIQADGSLDYRGLNIPRSTMLALAEENGLEFGLKLSNTFPVDVKAGELPSEEMYMAGKSLFPLTTTMAAMMAKEFGGKLRLSYAGGADAFNIDKLFACGI